MSHVITANGVTLATLPLPASLIKLFSVFRSGGRLFWPVYYTLVLAAFAGLARLPRGTVWITAAVVVQLWDISPALMQRHEPALHGLHEKVAGLLGRCRDLASFARGKNRRLLTEHGLAGAQRPNSPFDVHTMRKSQVDGIDPGIGQQSLRAGALAAQLVVSVDARVSRRIRMSRAKRRELLGATTRHGNEPAARPKGQPLRKPPRDRPGSANSPVDAVHVQPFLGDNSPSPPYHHPITHLLA